MSEKEEKPETLRDVFLKCEVPEKNYDTLMKSIEEAMSCRLGGFESQIAELYYERTQLLSLMVRMFPDSWLETDEEMNSSFRTVLVMTTPAGAVYFNIHEKHEKFFTGVDKPLLFRDTKTFEGMPPQEVLLRLSAIEFRKRKGK